FEKIFYYVLHNSTDFLLAGYSFELCLCDLGAIEALRVPVTKLSEALIASLKDDMAKNCILLAHWKSQSYFQENYTDLYDFCFCLHGYCTEFQRATREDEHFQTTQDAYKKMQEACEDVMEVLAKRGSARTVEQGPERPW